MNRKLKTTITISAVIAGSILMVIKYPLPKKLA